MWSDPPATAVGTLCFFACTDAAIERLNALLDDPKNDTRPFPQLAAEAVKTGGFSAIGGSTDAMVDFAVTVQ